MSSPTAPSPASPSYHPPLPPYHAGEPQPHNQRRHSSLYQSDTPNRAALSDRRASSLYGAMPDRSVNRTSSGSNPDGHTLLEFLQDNRHVPTSSRGLTDSRRLSTAAMNRKRRLTNTSDDAGQHRSRSNPFRPSNHFQGTSAAGSWGNRSGSDESISRQINLLRNRERSFTDYTQPRWQPDSEVSNCPICGTVFSFWFRKHHCRKCGRVVCASCSPHRITIPRQFIVRPPEPNSALSTIIQPNPSPIEVINLVDDEPSANSTSESHVRQGRQLNPALGGGEEVRLCNPCVPDPNPEPPRRYSSIESISPDANQFSPSFPAWNGGVGGNLPRAQLHRPSASLPSSSISSPSTASALPREQSRGTIFQPDNSDYRRAFQQERAYRGSLPSYGGFNFASAHDFRGSPTGYQNTYSGQYPGVAPPAYTNSTAPSSQRDLSSQRRRHTHGSSSSQNRPLPPPPRFSHRPRVRERDICPVCNHLLPPVGPNGNEEAREAHIRGCIEGHGRGRSGSVRDNASPPTTATRMLPFTATEKDCVGEDGTPQECTICMEEYEVGALLARLECLCKFHKDCIVDWFEHKQECPVHKVT